MTLTSSPSSDANLHAAEEQVPQQEFLRKAMSELSMTRQEFCARLGCAKRTLDKWLLPNASQDFRHIEGPVRTLVTEILAHEALKRACAQGQVPSEEGPPVASEVATDPTQEVLRLRAIIDRAKAESLLVNKEGVSALLVPYWFIKA